MVTVGRLARWLGVDETWLESVVASMEVPARQEGGQSLLDPRDIQPLLPGAGDLSRDLAALERLAVGAGIPATLLATTCERELEAMTEALGGASAVLVVPGQRGEPFTLASSTPNGNDPGCNGAGGGVSDTLGDIGRWVLECGDAVALTPPAPPAASGGRAQPRQTLALPLRAGQEVIAALVVTRDASASPLTAAQVGLAGAVAGRLALEIDRDRIRDSLERAAKDTELVRRQLEAYAKDVREAYGEEKRRAEQLAAALAELELTYLATVRGLAIAVEAKDEYTAGHLARVTRYGVMLLQVVAPDCLADPQFEYGFLLHDIGKLCVPDAVLRKAGPLTDEEWAVMRQHPDTGRRILEGIPFLRAASEIVHSHHERWDGRGYPLGLGGNDIPFGARIFPLADAFDAMTSNRPYRRAMPMEAALAEINRGTGAQFWPDAVEALLGLPGDELEAAMQAPSEWTHPVRAPGR